MIMAKCYQSDFPPDQEVEMDSQTASNNVTFSKFVKASTHRIDRDRARIGSFKESVVIALIKLNKIDL